MQKTLPVQSCPDDFRALGQCNGGSGRVEGQAAVRIQVQCRIAVVDIEIFRIIGIRYIIDTDIGITYVWTAKP